MEAGYIKTNDGYYGVIVGETKCFYCVSMEWDRKGHTKFSKQTYRQVGSPGRTMQHVEYADVPSVK